MISSWRTERHIGPATVTETLGSILRTAGLAALISAGGATLIVLIKMLFGDLPSVPSRIAVWCLFFGIIGGSVTLQWCLNRRWLEAAVVAGLVAVVAFVVWRLAAPAYFAIMCAQVACVYPVAP